MRIGVDEAREYFAHHTQVKETGITPDSLPCDGVKYYAEGGVCLAFHAAHWPGVAMVHLGAKPTAWGRAVEPAKRILRQYATDHDPAAVLAWIRAGNRQAIRFSQRVGFVETGRIAGGSVIQQEWTPCH